MYPLKLIKTYPHSVLEINVPHVNYGAYGAYTPWDIYSIQFYLCHTQWLEIICRQYSLRHLAACSSDVWYNLMQLRTVTLEINASSHLEEKCRQRKRDVNLEYVWQQPGATLWMTTCVRHMQVQVSYRKEAILQTRPLHRDDKHENLTTYTSKYDVLYTMTWFGETI